MMCFKDTTFCASSNCKDECGRKPPPDLEQQARRWWGGDGAPIAYSYFCGEENEQD